MTSKANLHFNLYQGIVFGCFVLLLPVATEKSVRDPYSARKVLHCNLVIFGHWVSENYRPKISKRKLRGYCYLVIGQNVCKNIYY